MNKGTFEEVVTTETFIDNTCVHRCSRRKILIFVSVLIYYWPCLILERVVSPMVIDISHVAHRLFTFKRYRFKHISYASIYALNYSVFRMSCRVYCTHAIDIAGSWNIRTIRIVHCGARWSTTLTRYRVNRCGTATAADRMHARTAVPCM